jgi:hypothetical protein
MREQAFADVSKVAIRVAIGSGSLIYLRDKNGGPRYVLAAQVAKHFPGGCTSANGEHESTATGDGCSGLGCHERSRPASRSACVLEYFNLHTAFSKVAIHPHKKLFECVGDDLLSLSNDPIQVVRASKTLGVNLIHILRARWSCREPSTIGYHFQSTNRCAVPWGFR